jgi:hypothetical protein
MDVKSDFLRSDLSEEIFMEQPPGFVTYSSLIHWLHKSLYGLKHAPRLWYTNIDHFFLILGFKHCQCDHNIYVLHDNNDTLIVVVYVDYLVITINNLDLIIILKR